MSLPRRIPVTALVVYQGRDYRTHRHIPTPTREDILPMEAEFSGRWRIAAWTAVLLVSLFFWVAFFAAVL